MTHQSTGRRRPPDGLAPRVRGPVAASLVTVLSVFGLGTGMAFADDATPVPAPATTTAPPAPKAASSTTSPATPTTPMTSTTTQSPTPTWTGTPTKPAAPQADSATPAPSKTTAAPKGAPSKRAAAPADKPVKAAPQAVPPASGNNAVITVKVGGDRDGVAGVTSLAGVVLGFYANATGGSSLFECTSDADGDCSITVPDTQNNGANVNKRFYVRQVSAPGGWYANPSLRTGRGDGTQSEATPYVFRTGATLTRGNTYRSTFDFMLDTGDTNRIASGGVWQNSRINPVLPETCGLKVGLVMDFSGSTANFNSQLKGAANTFVDALVGTPSSMSLFSFSTDSPATQATQNYPILTSVSTQAQADAFKARYSNWGSDGGTNWDRGLAEAAEAPNSFDAVVVITDGSPTFYNSPEQGPGYYGRVREAENGIFSANGVKGESTRVIAVGVGTGITADPNTGLNLRAISGPTQFNGSNATTADYYRTPDYTQAGAALKALAQGNCQGSVSVIKQVVPSTAPAGSITGAQPAGGWTIGASSTAPRVTVDAPTSRVTAVGTGAVNFPLTFSGGTTTGPVGIIETQQSGYALQPVGGKNAVCVRTDTGAAVTVTNQGALGFTVPASSNYPVSCTLYNRAPQPQSSVVVDKFWDITANGTTTRYPDGAQPNGFTALATINGSAQGWGDPRSGFSAGDVVTINETASVTGRPLCTLSPGRVTKANGQPATSTLPYRPTLVGGANSYEITNAVNCRTQLSVTKTVLNGPAAPAVWNLRATAPTGALPGPTGQTGTGPATNVPVTANVVYTLAESGGDPRYIQRANAAATPIPGSTISWECVTLSADGTTVIPGYSDGLNGGVSVPLGANVRCTASNYTATLQIRKLVENTNGGTAVPANFTITATPVGANLPPGLTAQTVTGSSVYQSLTVRPDVTYLITETGPAGYTQQSLECTVTAGQPRTDGTVVVPPLETGSCTVINADSPAKLTLVKTVTNDNGGTALPTAWTLSAAGPTPITGTTGAPAVTAAAVNAGTYTLAEAGGPAGYTAGSWTCTGAAVTGAVVSVLNGGDVTCTINNNDQAAKLTLVKTVTNDNGGTALPTAWTLSATGPSPITGTTGAPTVTAAAVSAGTYTLSEANGPAGYAASAWTCTGGTLTGASLVVPNGGNVTCTINNNDQAAKLTLVKTVTNDNGGTAVPTAWTLSATGPTPITGVTGAPTVTAATVNAGAYTLAETGPGGYTAGSWVCTGGAVTGTIVSVLNGGDVTCTINNNDQAAKLTLIKVVAADASGSGKVPADWTLTATPNAITGQPVVSGNGDNTSTGGVNQVPVFAGGYTLTETGPAGFTPGAWICQGGVFNGTNVAVPSGGNVTCTITNTAVTPTLTLIKKVVNANGGTAVARDWVLAAAGPSPITGRNTDATITAAPVKVGTYTLSEAGPDGYTPSDWVCTGGASTTATSVTLAEGQNATCTVTNTDQAATLTLVKTVTNDNGGTALPTAWTLSAAGPTPITGTTGAPAVTAAAVNAGDYTLAEAGGPAGYTPGSWTCTGAAVTGAVVSVLNGGDVTCTINNNDQGATLTLVKTVTNDNGGTAVPTAWTLSAAGPSPITGVTGATTVTAAAVSAGTYTLSEANGPAGYAASDWSCTGGTLTGASLVVPNGGNVTCTINNNDQAAKLTLVKTVTNDNGGTAVPTAWTLSATGPSPITGVTGAPTVTAATVSAGTYDLTEADGPAGYAASAWICTGGTLTAASVVVLNGSDVTCTINNDDQGATLTLVKTVTNDNGGTAVPTAWTLKATGPTPITGTTGSTAVTGAAVSAGTYTLSEANGPAGYAASAWTCTGGTLTGASLVLPNGGNVTCTINNNDQAAKLTLVKTVTIDNGGTALPTDWTLSAAGPTPITGKVGEPDVTGAPVNAGAYTLAETGPGGYTAGSWVCTGGAVTGTIVSVLNGGDVTCTINNNDQAATLTLIKDVDGDAAGSGKVPADWTLTATPVNIPGQDPVTGNGDNTIAGGVNQVPVFAGGYTLTETGPAGFTAGAWICQGGVFNGTNVAVPSGGNVTCTITNTAVTPTLTLIKKVVNQSGGTAVEADWLLNADGPSPVSGATGSSEVTAAPVKVGTYDLSETGPTGYGASGWVCTGGASTTASSVTLTEGQNATCTITNTDQVATLTLVKDVINDNGGTAGAAEWTLTAAGPTNGVTGVTGSPAITSAIVNAGKYDLSEADGPAGYAASAWTCTGGTLTGASVAVPNGGDVTCTITNNDLGATLTLVKTVTNNNGGTAAATAWTLKATGPTPITGTTGAPAVTAATVNAGTYVLSEADGPAGYAASAWSCTGGTLTGASLLLPNGGNVTCTINNNDDTPAWTLVKTSDPATGSQVPAGSTIDYTLKATNTYNPPVVGAIVTDDLSKVLNHATLVAVPAGATLTGTTLTWKVPTLAAKGDTASLTYQIKLNADAYGVTVTNIATPGPGGTCPGACTTTHKTPPKVVPPPVNPPPVNPPAEPGLPITGSSVAPFLGLGGFLVVLGSLALWFGRRPRRASEEA